MNRDDTVRLVVVCAFAVLAGCSTATGYRAPIIDRSFNADGSANNSRVSAGSSTDTDMMPVKREVMQHDKDWRPQSYVVQKGDTLYSIAFNFGFDYHDLASLNGIGDPSKIQVGQEIRLFAPDGTPATAQTAKVAPAGAVSATPTSRVPVTAVPVSGAGDQSIQWAMPASGAIIAGFSENDNRKGIDIGGKRGQPVSASAAGKVVYAGSGLRGYGKLVIIKHDSTYLSAYAHNDRLLVKEGQMVARGQKIAEMGSTDANRVELHFEIRKLGRPVDPAKYLPLPKS